MWRRREDKQGAASLYKKTTLLRGGKRQIMRPWSLKVAAIASLVLSLLSPGLPGSAQAAASPQAIQAPLSVSDCTTAQLSDVIAVYTSTPGPHATPVPLPPQTNGYLAHVLRERLDQCSTKLGGYVKGAAGPPTPASACAPSGSDVRMLWKQLQLCEVLLNPPVPASPIIKWQLPPTTGAVNQPVIFVVGAGGDPAMVGKLVSSLTVFLDQAGYYLSDNAVLIPEPGWSPDIFAAQCAQSPQVEGAIVVQITAAGSGSTDQFVSRKNWSAIEATALYAQCKRSGLNATGIPTYTWVSNIARAQNRYITVTPLTPLALLLTLGAAYEEFAPARTTTTTTTHVFPVPSPTPPGGYNTQEMTTNSKTVNASSLGGVAAGFLASAITYTNATLPLTAPPTVDQQTWDTLQAVATKLVEQMNCWQPSAKATGTFSDVVGGARQAPSYNPPPGLGGYNFGKPSAPFCEEPNPSASLPAPKATQTPSPQPMGAESIKDVLPSPLPTQRG